MMTSSPIHKNLFNENEKRFSGAFFCFLFVFLRAFDLTPSSINHWLSSEPKTEEICNFIYLARNVGLSFTPITVDHRQKKSSYNQIYEVLEIQILHFITLFIE